jgi:hypothetical protein
MEGVIAVFIPIAFFAMIAAIVIVPRYMRSQERIKMHEALKVAYEKGQTVPPELFDSFATEVKAAPSPHRDLRTGIIWLAVAAGFAALGFTLSFEEPDALYPLLSVAVFPAFIGIAFLVIAAIGAKRQA